MPCVFDFPQLVRRQTFSFSTVFILTALNPCVLDAGHAALPRTGVSIKKTVRSTDLYFHERVGLIEEHTIRSGPAAAHIYLEGGLNPYLFFAFPQGNSGVGVWFGNASKSVSIAATDGPTALRRQNSLNGASIDVRIPTNSISIEDTVLGSMRRIRDRELNVVTPPELRTRDIKTSDRKISMKRKSLNDLHDYVLEIEALGDTRVAGSGEKISLESRSSNIQFRVTGLTNEKPLTPLAPEGVFTTEALKKISPQQLKAFSFLLYKEKLMAGSPRYLSKFGRDSIFTLHALNALGVLRPEAVENLLSATLSSTYFSTNKSDPKNGRVSHEQHEGDFASWDRMNNKKEYRNINEVIEDYKMVDDNVAFALVAATYLARHPQRARNFLMGVDERGISRRTLLQNNFQFVTKLAAPFAKDPTFKNLVRLERGEKVGQWRDSENGLGGGVYPFDVNAAFMPGALHALAELYGQRGNPFENQTSASQLRSAFKVWNERAPALFTVKLDAQTASTLGQSYLKSRGLSAPANTTVPREGFEFPAISLDDNGRPVKIMHSDDSLMMMFGFPSEPYLRGVVQRVTTNWPYGLKTEVGILVATPTFETQEIRDRFGPDKYHGEVIWKMQEDFLVLGINRQLERRDLPRSLRSALEKARAQIDQLIAKKAHLGGTEVFAVHYKGGVGQAVPFAGDAKSNSNQLWSHLRIANPQGK